MREGLPLDSGKNLGQSLTPFGEHWRDHPPQTPAGHRGNLGKTMQGDDAIFHARKRRGRAMGRIAVPQGGVDLVRDQHGVRMGGHGGGDAFNHVVWECHSSRVSWRIQHHCGRVWRDGRRDGFRIGAESVFKGARNFHHLAPAQFDHGFVRHPRWGQDHHFITTTGFEKRLQHQEEGHLASRRQHNVVRSAIHTTLSMKGRDGFSSFWCAGNGLIAMLAVFNGLPYRGDGRWGRRKIRLAG